MQALLKKDNGDGVYVHIDADKAVCEVILDAVRRLDYSITPRRVPAIAGAERVLTGVTPDHRIESCGRIIFHRYDDRDFFDDLADITDEIHRLGFGILTRDEWTARQ